MPGILSDVVGNLVKICPASTEIRCSLVSCEWESGNSGYDAKVMTNGLLCKFQAHQQERYSLKIFETQSHRLSQLQAHPPKTQSTKVNIRLTQTNIRRINCKGC